MSELRGFRHGYRSGGSGVSATTSVALPAGTQAGDLLVLVVGDDRHVYTPSGWTKVHAEATGTNDTPRGLLAHKVATADDITAGTISYAVQSSLGRGVYALLAIEAGSFRASDPVAKYLVSRGQPLTDSTGVLPVATEQDHFSFAFAPTTQPESVWAQRGNQLYQRDADPQAVSALAVERADRETTLWQTWDSTTSAASYKLNFTLHHPVGTTVFGGLTSQTHLMAATYALHPVGPPEDEFLMDAQPVLQVMADGNPEPFQIQFQVSTSRTDFSSPSWETTLIDRFSGESSAQVGILLDDGKPYYWRARAGDGTTWGPWCSPQRLLALLGRAAAREYLYLNVGPAITPRDQSTEYLYQSTGANPAPTPQVREYLHQNVGAANTRSARGIEYAYYGDVNQAIPEPHLWFAYRRSGFGGDHVYLYGQGLGTLAEQYGATLYMDYGPNFESWDLELGIFDWLAQAATADAYGPDRRIFPGLDSTPPFSNVETHIVEVVTPTEVSPSQTQGPQTNEIYLIHIGGTSNRVDWMAYPNIPVPMTITPTTNRTNTVIRVIAEPEEPGVLIPVSAAYFEAAPYIVAGPDAVRTPMMGSYAVTEADHTLYDTTESLQAASAVTLPVYPRRWIPDAATIEARPDLGTGVSIWTPSEGTTDQYWRMTSPEAPYLDPAYRHASRLGELARQAMVFEGDEWMEYSHVVADGPRFGIAITAVLHPSEAPEQVLLSSYSSLTQTPGVHQIKLAMVNNRIEMRIGGRMAAAEVGQLSARPVTIIFTTNTTTGRLLIQERRRRVTKGFTHPNLESNGMKLYLGRPSVQSSQSAGAQMDLLDVAVWQGNDLPWYRMHKVASLMDGIYGISGSRS